MSVSTYQLVIITQHITYWRVLSKYKKLFQLDSTVEVTFVLLQKKQQMSHKM